MSGRDGTEGGKKEEKRKVQLPEKKRREKVRSLAEIQRKYSESGLAF